MNGSSLLVRRLGVLMATVFVDMLGFAMVLPLLPFYALRFGADPFTVGVLVAAYPFAQLATSPLWGRLSDRYGRRPMILAGLLISAVAFVLFGLADSILVLLVARVAQGAGGGTTGVVQAYVGDTAEPAERASALGWITAASSAGVMMGPALGSLASGIAPEAPGFLAAGLCVLNFFFGWWMLPESSSPAERAAAGPPRRGFVVRAVTRLLRHPGSPVGSLVWIYALALMAFMALNGVLALFLQARFGVTEKTIGWFYVYVGAISVLMRTLVLGCAVRRFGEIRVLRIGAACLAVGLGLMPFAQSLALLAFAIFLVPAGTALLFPSTTSLVSRRVPRSELGQTLGLAQSVGGVARLVGPVWSGAAFQHLGVSAPFLLASAVMVVVSLWAAWVRAVEGEWSLAG